MSNHPKIPLDAAAAIAEDILVWLSPVVDRAEVAGSIRRRVPEVSDIEIVCIPKVEETVLDLFGQVTDTTNLLDARVAEDHAHEYKIAYRTDKNGRAAVGSRYKRLWWGADDPNPVALDLFAVLAPARFGVIMAIRTGPAAFSQRLVTQQSKGGLLPNHMWVRDGLLWSNGGMSHGPGIARLDLGGAPDADAEAIDPPDKYGGSSATISDGNGDWRSVQEEADFFEAIGLAWIPPEARR